MTYNKDETKLCPTHWTQGCKVEFGWNFIALFGWWNFTRFKDLFKFMFRFDPQVKYKCDLSNWKRDRIWNINIFKPQTTPPSPPQILAKVQTGIIVNPFVLQKSWISEISWNFILKFIHEISSEETSRNLFLLQSSLKQIYKSRGFRKRSIKLEELT